MDNTIHALPKVRFGEWISEGWNMFAEQWKVWVVNALVLSIVTTVPLLGLYILMLVVPAVTGGRGGAGLGATILALLFLGGIAIALLASYVSAGMYRTAFKQLRGEPISTIDLFSGGDRWPAFLGASILVTVLVLIGTLLCVLPGFIVGGALYFTLPLIVERRLSVGEAIQASRDATRGELFMFVLFALVVSLIAQAGTYLCYVGLLATMPLHYTIAAIAFRDCFGVPGARSFASKLAPPHAYGAPPPSGFQAAGAQQWSGYAPPPPSAVYQPPPPATAPQPQTPTGAVLQAPTGEITTCPDCNAELPASARFCARCGRSLIQS